MDFRVDLNLFRGPLDLLLYLVRKHEVEIVDIPIAEITEQYLRYLEVLEELNVDSVGDFLAVAATLIEIKSQQVLPRADEVQDEIEDPRQELVRRLLEYKKYRDAASILEERGRQWQQQFARLSDDIPPRDRNLADEPIREIELWDLVSAFGRIVRANVAIKPSNIIYDETPIHVYMEQIHGRLLSEGQLAFSQLFRPEMHKSTQIGIFLAILELVRHRHILLDQNDLFGEIWLVARTDGDRTIDFSQGDNYDHAPRP